MISILHNRKLKGALDRFAAFLGIIVTAPIFLIVAVILKLRRDDVFFVQERVGLNLKIFRMLKFTTMLKGSEEFGSITRANDTRITLFGRILRQTKINEIPQLFNIIKGDMSFVGPRPLPMSEVVGFYSMEDASKIYSVKPGITGIGSLEFCNEEDLLDAAEDHEEYFARVVMPRKAMLELGYVDNWNLFLDLKIVVKTVFRVFLQILTIPIKLLRPAAPGHMSNELETVEKFEALTVERSDK